MPQPDFLGPYRITKTIGRGGMGTVYAAIDTQSGQSVALKLIAQQLAAEERFRERFTAEINALYRLRHNGIVRFLHSHIDEEGQIYYTMELVEGETLHARIRREKKLGWQFTIDSAIQICSALKHAHDTGVIHRDLKPANLMVSEDGLIKLVDFGIAKVFGDNQMTHAGSVLGTADYMAPEQATSTGISQRTDLYALGNVMYAMLTGRPPFTGKKVTAVIESLKRDRPVPLDLIDPQLPDELVELIHQLLEKDPNDRPPTALVVMKRLQSMRAGLGRDQTLIADNKPTFVNEPDPRSQSPRKSDGNTHDSGSATDATVSGASRTGQHAKPADSSVSPNAATSVSRGSGQTVLADADDLTTAEPSRRQAVTDFHLDDDLPQRRTIFHQADESTSTWAHWAGVAAMIAVLLVGGALFVFAVLPPSADKLFASASSGDTGAMRTFLRRFPEDPRVEEVRSQLMSGRLKGVLNRLTTQASIGVTPLEPAEESFVNAMQPRLKDPAKSADLLQQWLDLYGTPGNEQDPALAELIELARYERTQLATESLPQPMDPRAEKMIAEIRAIAEKENAEVARKKLTAIIQLHGSDGWAQPAVAEAERQLDRI